MALKNLKKFGPQEKVEMTSLYQTTKNYRVIIFVDLYFVCDLVRKPDRDLGLVELDANKIINRVEVKMSLYVTVRMS